MIRLHFTTCVCALCAVANLLCVVALHGCITDPAHRLKAYRFIMGTSLVVAVLNVLGVLLQLAGHRTVLGVRL